MKLTVALEARFYRTPDGSVWSESVPAYPFWRRYLQVFDAVEVVARVREAAAPEAGWVPAGGEGVTFLPLPYYLGPYQYLLKAAQVERALSAALGRAEAVLLRSPGQVSGRLYSALKRSGRPFGVEVVGDPCDVFAPGSVDHPLRRFFRWLGVKQLREQCRRAAGAAYVTEGTLQQRYPNDSYRTHYSSIDIGSDSYLPSPRSDFGERGNYRALFVGSLAQLYKSPDLLLEAVALCRSRGVPLTLTVIGEGRFRPRLEEQAARLGVGGAVRFLGQLPAGEAVRRELMQGDLFVLPSRTEGLPRAMIEAMACGLPCIGSAVGGIPELLPPDSLVPPGDAEALAARIAEFLSRPGLLRKMSARNLAKAQEYRNDVLEERRRGFYTHLRDRTRLWMEGKGGRI